MINKKSILKFNPCDNRFDNYLKFYDNRDFNPRQFMGLKNITHEDKVWVAVRMISQDKIRFAAADIAELVLPIFEKQFPGDSRPRRAIEATRIGNLKEMRKTAVYAHAAAWGAAGKTAGWAANSAAYAAAWGANWSAYDADTKAADAEGAADWAYRADNSDEMKKKIRTVLLKYWK